MALVPPSVPRWLKMATRWPSVVSRVAEAQSQAEDIRIAGGRALALPFDVTDPSAVAAAVEATVEAFGGLDFLVLAAAYNCDGLVAGLPPLKRFGCRRSMCREC